MTDRTTSREESRHSPRFVPEERLSMFLAANHSPLVHGDIQNLSEVGACVRTDAALEGAGIVTVNVRNGYSFLFRAEARIVWRSHSTDCAHGMLFTELSAFARKLIRRMSGARNKHGTYVTSSRDADSDPDLQILFRTDDDDRFDLLVDPTLEKLFLDEQDAEELSGNLGYFDNSDVLQMLETTRATGVLYVEGECTGEIRMLDGKIVSAHCAGASNDEAAYRLITARYGRFCFIPARVRGDVGNTRTTAQLVLEAQLHLDESRRPAIRNGGLPRDRHGRAAPAHSRLRAARPRREPHERSRK